MRVFNVQYGLLTVLAVMLAGCRPAMDKAAPAAAVEREPVLMCGEQGRLETELYGAVSARLQWNREQLECSGMPRPEGQGARLRFAGHAGDLDRRISVIIAIPALRRSTTGLEYASNVTVIEEGGGRFFSTSDLDNCLTDITALEPIDDSGDRFAIGGVLYCVSPLAEINGPSSLSLTELRFKGLLDWGAS